MKKAIALVLLFLAPICGVFGYIFGGLTVIFTIAGLVRDTVLGFECFSAAIVCLASAIASLVLGAVFAVIRGVLGAH